MKTGMKLQWYLKIPLKILLTRIPLSHKLWNKIGIFKHGGMQDFSYAQGVFSGHLGRAGLQEKEKNIDKILLELGPGESLFSALLAKSYHFKRSILLDVGDFALPSLSIYQNFSQWLGNNRLSCPSLINCDSIASMLTVLNSQYLTNGLKSLNGLPDDSVDFIFSHAVLEHIRKNDFEETMKELWRVLKPGGVSTHVVDFKDHLEKSINNLRFRDSFWETQWIASSGFYTNRIRFGEMLRIFESQGFRVEVSYKSEWPAIPISRQHLHPRFRALPDSDLKTSGAAFCLHKQA